MKIHLPDTARQAFQFLLLAIGVLVGLRLLYTALVLWMDPPVTTDLAVAIDSLRNGYLISDRQAWPVGGVDLPGRLALAFLTSVAGGIVGSLLGWAIDRIRKIDAWRGAALWARVGIVLCGALALYSALMLPPNLVRVSDNGIEINTCPTLFGVMGLPFRGSTETIAWAAVGEFHVQARGLEQELVIDHGTDRIIASAPLRESEGIDKLAVALRAVAARSGH